MNEENSRKIYEAGPNLFRKEIRLQCGDGWFELIFNLVEVLEKLVVEQYRRFGRNEGFLIYPTQIGEKWGSLNFYMSTATEEMYNLIESAEDKSLTVCDMCGKKGELKNSGGWRSVKCENCD